MASTLKSSLISCQKILQMKLKKKKNSITYETVSVRLLKCYKILSNIILGRLTAYVDQIIDDH